MHKMARPKNPPIKPIRNTATPEDKRAALKGLSHRQQKLVKIWHEPESLAIKAEQAGFAKSVAHSMIYKITNSPKFQRAISLYYQLGEDDFIGDLSVAHITDTLLDDNAPRASKDRMATLAAEVSGKRKQVNINKTVQINVSEETLRDEVLNIIKGKQSA